MIFVVFKFNSFFFSTHTVQSNNFLIIPLFIQFVVLKMIFILGLEHVNPSPNPHYSLGIYKTGQMESIIHI